MNFDEEYYTRIIFEQGYKSMAFSPISFGLAKLSEDFLKYKWLCHVDGDKFSSAYRDNKKCIVTTGFGLSGSPHVGTVSQILGAILLQKSGLKVQIVLGDLDSYNSRNIPLSELKERTSKYANFITAIGFDSNLGILRNQIDHPEIMLTAYLSANALTDFDFEQTEEDISYLYKQRKVYQGIEFPVKQSILLMVSDFIHLRNNFDNVLVILGIDEHKYVQLARNIISRQHLDFPLSGMYSKIIKGFNGFPKMSKSIPGSGLTVDSTEDEIFSLIVDYDEFPENPHDSTVFQMMCHMSDYLPNKLDVLYKACKYGGKEWEKYKRSYADYVIELFKKWSK